MSPVGTGWHPGAVRLSVYRPVLALPDARAALLLGFFIRVPLFAGGVILTLHVVTALHRSYGAAGLLTTAATIALALSSPWRGRMLDRRGLRRVVVPSLARPGGLLVHRAVGRLLVAHGAGGAGRALRRPDVLDPAPGPRLGGPAGAAAHRPSLDSIGTEFSFMAGPALGVWAATMWHTGWAIFVFEWLSIVAGIVLVVINPALRGAGGAEPGTIAAPVRSWFSLQVLAVLAASAAATVVLAGTDVSIVATLRDMGAQQHIGWVLALWGAGSIVGGVVYGAWHRSIEAFWLLAGLALVTAPVALAANLPVAAVLILVSGLFCAPTITATVDTLTRLVPERSRGEAIGWHGSSMTAGMALGAPVAGFAIDAGGWRWGYVVVSALGLAVAAVGGARARATLPPARRGPVEDSSLAAAR